jgi:hypothetical protein
VYERQRRRLLAFRPTQARSRYGDVYATFEASAAVLQTSSTEVAGDALHLLPLLAACGPSRFPLSVFEAGWGAALILTEAFFHAMGGAFCFVLREQFLQEMFSFSKWGATRGWNQRRWLAQANLMWAIDSKWLQITKLDDLANVENHLMYYARARALGLDHRMMFDHPDLARVQDIGLLAFYLLMNGSITKYVLGCQGPLRLLTFYGQGLEYFRPCHTACYRVGPALKSNRSESQRAGNCTAYANMVLTLQFGNSDRRNDRTS